MYSRCFSTFLGDNEKERAQLKRVATPSSSPSKELLEQTPPTVLEEESTISIAGLVSKLFDHESTSAEPQQILLPSSTSSQSSM